METVSSAIEFLQLIRKEKEVEVQFVKKDNTIRRMICTLDFEKIPKEKRPKGVDLIKILKKIQTSKILSVYDLEKQDWRSIPFERLDYLKTKSNNKIYKLSKLK
jgi:HD-like signal output (HDOD) protein